MAFVVTDRLTNPNPARSPPESALAFFPMFFIPRRLFPASDDTDLQPESREGAGRALIVQTGNRIRINGELRETGLPVPWHTEFGLLSPSGGVFFYYKVQEGRGSNGLCMGRLLAKNPTEFYCNFDDVKSFSENAGIALFKRVGAETGR